MFSVAQTKNQVLCLLSAFHYPHPTDQWDFHVLLPKYVFNHASTFIFFHITGERVFQLVQLCSLLNHPPNLFSNMQPENVLSVMLLSCLKTFQWFPIANLVIPTSVQVYEALHSLAFLTFPNPCLTHLSFHPDFSLNVIFSKRAFNLPCAPCLQVLLYLPTYFLYYSCTIWILFIYWLPCSLSIFPTTLISMRAENISVLFTVVSLMLRTFPGPFIQQMFVKWIKWDNGYNILSIVLANGKYSINVKSYYLKYCFSFTLWLQCCIL